MNEANTFDAGDETTHFALETNAFSAKGRTRLTLKANVFGAGNELICLAIYMNAFHVEEEPKTQR